MCKARHRHFDGWRHDDVQSTSSALLRVDLPDIPHVELKIFHRPGTKLEHVHEPLLGDVFNYRPDLCIVLMGGNDIGIPQADRTEVMDRLRAYLLELKEITPDLRWMNMEKRFYPWRNRYGVNNE